MIFYQEIIRRAVFRQAITEVTKSVDLQPLQYLASMRVAISVCEAEDMQGMMRTFRKPGRTVPFTDDQWELLRCRGRRKLHKIGAPDRIVDIISENLWTISFEIFKWMSYHAEDTGIDGSPAFCWTPRFVIDYVKTAEILTKNETLDMKKRFKLACYYCLEADLRSLWRMMSLSDRRFFFVRGNLDLVRNLDQIGLANQNLIVLYWTYYIQEVPMDYWACKTLEPNKLLYYSVEKGYLRATTYFYNKQETIRMIMWNLLNGYIFFRFKSVAPDDIVKDQLAIFCFLICRMNWKYVTTAFFHRYELIFLYFLEWPWQKHFMTIVNQLRPHINESAFGQLLKSIFEKEMKGFKDHDYKELFMEFWLQSPENCKTYVNRRGKIGYDMLLGFVAKHFGFVFEERSFILKKKFRGVVFEQNGSENAPNFEPKNVEFFRFLIRAQVATRATIQRYSILGLFGYRKGTILPLGELLYLFDRLLRNVLSYSQP